MNLNINDIARLANVSKATVSRVINNTGQVSEKTKHNVLEIIEKYNYHPNSFAQAISTQSQKSRYIAVIIPHNEAYIMSNPVYAELFRGISEVLTLAGYFMLSCFTKDADYIKNLYLQKRVDGFILLSPTDNEYSLLYELHTMNAPFISSTSCEFNDHPKQFHVPYMDIDNYKAAQMAMQHLIGLGHRKIAFLSTHTTSSAQGKLASILLRQKAYNDALISLGIPVKSNLTTLATNISIEAGYEAMNSLFRSTKDFTAIFCCADLLAIGALKAIKDTGFSVPADISIIGFDGIPWTNFTDPPLTTIGQDAYIRGTKIAQALVNLLENGIPPIDTIYDADFIHGASTAPPSR